MGTIQGYVDMPTVGGFSLSFENGVFDGWFIPDLDNDTITMTFIDKNIHLIPLIIDLGYEWELMMMDGKLSCEPQRCPKSNGHWFYSVYM